MITVDGGATTEGRRAWTAEAGVARRCRQVPGPAALLVLALAFAGVAAGAVDAPAAMPASTSFEAGDAGAFSRWSAHTWEPAGSPRSRTSRDTAVGHTGKASLRVDGAAAASQGYWNGPQLPATPGERYRATVWVRADLAAGSGLARMQMGFRDKSGEIVVAEGKPWYEGWLSAPVTGVRDWVQTGVAAKAPEGAATVTISVKLIGIGTAWFDDAAIAGGDQPVPVPPPTLAGESRLLLPSPVSGAEPARLTLRNPYAEALSGVTVVLSGPVEGETKLESLPAGGSRDVSLSFRNPPASPGERARFDVRLAYSRAGRQEAERLFVLADVIPQDLVAAVRSDKEVVLPPAQAGTKPPVVEVLGVATGKPGERRFAFPSAPLPAETLAPGFAVAARVANPAAERRQVTLAYEVLDTFWRGEKGERAIEMGPGEVRLVPVEVSPAMGARILQASASARAEVFRIVLRVGGVQSRRDVRLTPPAEKTAALPALPESRRDVPPFGSLRLVDEVDFGDASDPHPIREGAKGLNTKGTSEPLDRYDGQRLTFEWQESYRDNRERFSEVREILGRRCRVADNWGWFGVRLGRGGLKSGRYYVAEIEYPEDAPRTFCIWNTLDTHASFGFHTGDSLGDPFTRQRFIERSPYPLSGEYRTWRSLFRCVADGDGWIFIHSMGDRAAPFSQGVAVSRLRIWELGDVNALAKLAVRPAVALPDDLPQRHFVFLQEDANAAAACLPELQYLGFDTYSPLMLSYAGGTYATNSGFIDWPSKLFGRGDAVRNPHARANPEYYRHNPSPTRYEQALAAAREGGVKIVPCLEYAGTGLLPEEALAVDLDGTPALYYWGSERLPDGTYRPRRLKEGTCIDMAHPAVGEDLCRLLEEVAGAYARDYPNLAGVELTHRFNAWQVSYSDYEMERFARETGTRVPGASQPERAAWIVANRLKEYTAFHAAKKRENLLKARDHLRRIRPDLTLFVLNWVGGDDCLPFGGILWYQGKEQGDEFVIPGKPYLMAKGKRSLAQLLEDVTRPDVRMQSVPLNPPLYRKDEGILNWAVGHYRFTADSPEYLEYHRSGSGVAFCNWWIYNEDCYLNNPAIGWNCPGLHGNEHAGRFCMTEEVCAVAAADPVALGVRMGFINRGFPEHARRFAAAYRALPALPSTVVKGAFPDAGVVVRRIATKHGDYYAVADRRLALDERAGALRLPATRPVAQVVDLATGKEIPFRSAQGSVSLDWRSEAMSLSALRVEYR